MGYDGSWCGGRRVDVRIMHVVAGSSVSGGRCVIAPHPTCVLRTLHSMSVLLFSFSPSRDRVCLCKPTKTHFLRSLGHMALALQLCLACRYRRRRHSEAETPPGRRRDSSPWSWSYVAMAVSSSSAEFSVPARMNRTLLHLRKYEVQDDRRCHRGAREERSEGRHGDTWGTDTHAVSRHLRGHTTLRDSQGFRQSAQQRRPEPASACCAT